MEKQPMTEKGKVQLEEELKNLIQVERPAVIKAIEEARGHGDLSENADYDAAKERQGFIEHRIGQIQGTLAVAEVVDPKSIAKENKNKILFGATVTILDCDSEKESKYQIVGIDEADVKAGFISVFSPISRALIGKKVGDAVEIQSPGGDKEFEVLKIEYI